MKSIYQTVDEANPYQILIEKDPYDLKKKVNIHIKRGYEPHGGLAYDSERNAYAQAIMFKRGKKK